MEHLTQAQPEQSQEMTDGGSTMSDITLDQAKAIDFFGVDQNDYESVEKIDKILGYVPSIDELRFLDLKLGNDGTMSRIDKIYVYIEMLKQNEELQNRQELVKERIRRMFI
jgi:LPS O-antigen subunit length determinant protein (WzzB/FepE family)